MLTARITNVTLLEDLKKLLKRGCFTKPPLLQLSNFQLWHKAEPNSQSTNCKRFKDAVKKPSPCILLSILIYLFNSYALLLSNFTQ